MKIALSTLAMSAYNVMTRSAGPTPARSVFNIVREALEDHEITEDTFAAALARLESMKYITIVDKEKGLVDVTDPKRRLVRWRDRNGDGWSGWKVEGDDGLPKKLVTMTIDLGAAE